MRFTVELSPDEGERLRRMAEAEQRSCSNAIRRAVVVFLDSHHGKAVETPPPKPKQRKELIDA